MPSGVYKRTEWHRKQIKNQYDFVPGAAQEAREKGLKIYHGTPCKVCGGTERYISCSACVPCLKKATAHKLKDLDKYKTRANTNAKTYRYRTRKKNQMPSDADNNLIAEFYKESERLTKETGIQHHVDHIQPLSKGGLHHQDNLQVLTATENVKKGNKI